MRPPRRQCAFPLDPALDFLQNLWELNHALERTSLQMRRALGVTAQQRLMVRCIGKYPGLTASQLATMLHLDRATVSVGLGRMEKKRLVTRTRDPGDGRRATLGLTAKGRSVDLPQPATVEHAVERLLATATAREVAAAKRLLRGLAEDLTADLPRRR